MADIFSQEQRSKIMGCVRGRGNRTTELRLIMLLRQYGLSGWQRGSALFGNPDFVWRRERIAVFVDGCFWHGCPRHRELPASRQEYWRAKLARNQSRDRIVTKTLRAAGWQVIRIWECALTRKREAATANRLARAFVAKKAEAPAG